MREGTNQEAARERTLLRLGAVSAVLGSAANVVASVGHGDLPETGTHDALHFVAERDTWSLVHLTSIFAVLLWLVAFVVLGMGVSLWMAAMGVLMWRRAGGASAVDPAAAVEGTR